MMNVQQLAREFARELSKELGPLKLSYVNANNATPAYRGACASHDYCDANICMLIAFIRVYGGYPKPDSEYDVKLMNAAWEIARSAGFEISRIKES